MSVEIVVDDKTLQVERNRSVLQACLENGIFIPNLCHVRGMAHPPASCRLCFVEAAGRQNPVTACTLRVSEGLRIRTDTPAVRRLQRTALRFLLSVHDVDCKNCPANKKCELQRLARFLKVGLKATQLENVLSDITVDEGHPCFSYYRNRCVLCGRCVYVCRREQDRPLLSFSGRGFSTRISFYGHQDGNTDCRNCQACIEVCPVAALTGKSAGGQV